MNFQKNIGFEFASCNKNESGNCKVLRMNG